MYLKKELYELLRTDESIFDFIQDSALDGLWYWDLEHPENEWMNAKFWTVLGYNPDEMPHKSTAWQNIINQDDLKVANENFTKHCENPNHPYDQVVRYTHKNGSTVWIRCRGLAIRDENGKAIRMLGAHQDISEIKRTEQELIIAKEKAEESEAKLNALFTSMSEMVVLHELVFDENGEPVNYRITDCNDAFMTITGIPRKNAIGRLSTEVYGTEQPPYFKEYSEVALTGEPCHYETYFQPMDKHFSVSVISPEKNQFATVTTDITDRKRSEEALNHSHNLMKYIIEHTRSAVAVHDRDLRYIYASQRYIDEYKVKHEDIIGKHHYDVFPDLPQKWREVHQRALAGEILSAEDDPYVREDGSVEWTRWQCRPWHESDGSIGGIIVYTEVITNRKRMEETLRESEENLSITLHSIGDGVITTDKFGMIDKMNPVALKFCGWHEDEIKGKPLTVVFNIINADTREPVPNPVEKVIESGEIVGLANHTILVAKDGSEYQIADSAAPIKDKDGNIKGVVLVFSDVSEKYAAEQSLVENEQRLNAILSNTPAVIYTYAIDKDGIPHMTYINENVKKILGFVPNDFINDMELWARCVHPEDMPNLQEKLSGKDMSNEYRFKDKAGNYHWLLDNQKVLNDKDGEKIIIGTWWDFTERKKSEEALFTSEDRYNRAISGTGAGLWDWDMVTNAVYFSPQWKKMLGYEDHEVPNDFSGWRKLWHPDEVASNEKAVKDYLEGTSKVYEVEHRLLCKDGSWHWILTRGDIEKDSSGKPIRWTGTNIDITERKQAEKELFAAKEKAEESDRLKSAFLANMSHEIRTPMNGIMGFAELLKEPDLNSENREKYIGIIEKSGARMLNIINDIVDISKIEAGQMKLDINESNIAEQIEDIYTFFKPEAEAKKISLSYTNPLSAKEAIIKTDREKLYAVLTNLVKNAIKYTHEGSIELGCNLKTAGESKVLEFYVKDTGIGISKDRQKAIFERFIQADIADKMAYQGAGLGLAISKAYVEMLGGEIWIESQEGKGSTFYFTLPYKTDHQETDAQNIDESTREKEDQVKNLKILIVEDDELSAMLMSEYVQTIGKEILQAGSGGARAELEPRTLS